MQHPRAFILLITYIHASIGAIQCPKDNICILLNECNDQHEKAGKPLDKNVPLGRCSYTQDKYCCPVLSSAPSAIVTPPQTPPPVSTTPKPVTQHPNFHLIPPLDKCGFPSPHAVTTELENKISDGKPSSRGAFPWMALLYFGIRDENKGTPDDGQSERGEERPLCGGSLISARYVLTAAHCVTDTTTILKYVRIGAHDARETCRDVMNLLKLYKPDLIASEQCFINVKVSKIIIHNNYDVKLKNDIALLRLERDALPSGNYFISVACLPFPVFEPVKLNETFYAAGWGAKWFDATEILATESILRNVTIKGTGKCNMCNGGNDTALCPLDHKIQLCIESERSSRDVCKGDSGGPIMVQRSNQLVQVGVVSAKPTEKCGAEGVPSIYTRVDGYLDWILDKMEP